MFEDKVFDGLDDISKILEPYTYSVNELLDEAPDQIEITYEDIEEHLLIELSSSSAFKVKQLLKMKWEADDVDKKIINKVSELSRFYTIKCDENVSLNLHDKTLNGKVFINKTGEGIPDDKLKDMINDSILEGVRNTMYTPANFSKPFANEIAELFDIKGVSSERGARGKKIEMIKGFEELLSEDKLMIRDVDLAKRFAIWLHAYMRYGNLGAIKNLCKLKILSHKKRAIYSIQDEVEV